LSENADDLEESGCSACDDTDGESGPRRKLTRAQRKRLRKKKLKEDASRRGNMVGPLLRPSTSESEGGDVETEPPDVRRNAAEKKVDATAANSGEDPHVHARTETKVSYSIVLSKAGPLCYVFLFRRGGCLCQPKKTEAQKDG